MSEQSKAATSQIEVLDCPIQYKGQILKSGETYEIELKKAKELEAQGIVKIIKGK